MPSDFGLISKINTFSPLGRQDAEKYCEVKGHLFSLFVSLRLRGEKGSTADYGKKQSTKSFNF
jgi:hypothetical protein